MAEPPGRRYCTHDALPHGPKTLHENSRNDAPEPPARRPSARRQLCGGVARARNLRADMHVLRGRVPRRTGSPRAASPLHPRQPRLRRRLHCRRSDSDAANGNARRTRPRAVARLYCRLPHVQRGVQAARRNARSLPHLRRNLPALSAAVQFSAGCNELGRDRREREPALSAPHGRRATHGCEPRPSSTIRRHVRSRMRPVDPATNRTGGSAAWGREKPIKPKKIFGSFFNDLRSDTTPTVVNRLRAKP